MMTISPWQLCITDMDKAFYRLTIMDIRVLVSQYCKRNEIDNPCWRGLCERFPQAT